jgi:hypothetical protein
MPDAVTTVLVGLLGVRIIAKFMFFAGASRQHRFRRRSRLRRR